jgi:hypothetical protein
MKSEDNAIRHFTQCKMITNIKESLSSEQEEVLKDVHAESYMGTDDDMPEAYEAWLESLTDAEVEKILKDADTCKICGGTGEVSCDERDSDGNIQRGVGTQKCECQCGEPDDFSGATEGDR